MTSSIVHILAREAQAEHNPYKWELSVMLYALERMRDTAKTAGAPAKAAPVLEPLTPYDRTTRHDIQARPEQNGAR